MQNKFINLNNQTMKNKILISGTLVLLMVLSFLFYTNNSNLIADDKDGKKDCSSQCTQKAGSTENKSSCTDSKTMSDANSSDNKDGFISYEFVTDKITCDDCKPGISNELMGISGVKEISYGETCKVSKMTSVKVIYSPEETSPEIISASVKEKGLEGNCGDGSKCNSKTKTEKKS